MSNDNQSIEEPIPVVINPTTVSARDRTVIEPMILSDETKNRRLSLSSPSFVSANKIFVIALFILLVILISYILFHGKVTDNKLTRLADNADLNPGDTKKLLEEINHTLKSIELHLGKQTQKTNINVVLNRKDINEFHSNQTVLYDFIRRIQERL
jgi:hypothetical protein